MKTILLRLLMVTLLCMGVVACAGTSVRGQYDAAGGATHRS